MRRRAIHYQKNTWASCSWSRTKIGAIDLEYFTSRPFTNIKPNFEQQKFRNRDTAKSTQIQKIRRISIQSELIEVIGLICISVRIQGEKNGLPQLKALSTVAAELAVWSFGGAGGMPFMHRGD